MMKNKPNFFRVTYEVMEGDNYAGGWGERYADIKKLADAKRFDRIKKVVPIFIEVGDPLDIEVVNQAIDESKNLEKIKEKEREIKRLEKRLKTLKNEAFLNGKH
jgi:hypothetical protein